MTQQDRCCGTCRYWAEERIDPVFKESIFRECTWPPQHLPYAMFRSLPSLSRPQDGTTCPTWEARDANSG